LPPQTSISVPVQTALWVARAEGAPARLVGIQTLCLQALLAQPPAQYVSLSLAAQLPAPLHDAFEYVRSVVASTQVAGGSAQAVSVCLYEQSPPLQLPVENVRLVVELAQVAAGGVLHAVSVCVKEHAPDAQAPPENVRLVVELAQVSAGGVHALSVWV